jgi:hypothetical protein
MAGITTLDDRVRGVLARLSLTVADSLGDASGELRDFALWIDPDTEPEDDEAKAANRFYATDDKPDDDEHPELPEPDTEHTTGAPKGSTAKASGARKG